MSASAVIVQDLPITERRKPIKRQMTYQVVMRGVDGMVIASDKLEGHFREDGTIARGDDVTKIVIEGDLAWASSGGDLGKIFSAYLTEAFKGKRGIASDEEIIALIESCRKPANALWMDTRSGPDSNSRVTLACGSSGTIFRIDPLLYRDETKTDSTKKGRCISGQITNTASFLCHRLHHTDMSVDALVMLAAYSIRMAATFDSSCIDLLDIAVFRKEDKIFRFIDSDYHWEHSPDLENSIRDCIAKNAFPVNYK